MRTVPKRSVAEGVPPHPATFSKVVLERIYELLGLYSHPGAVVLDPFAGVGLVHELRPMYETLGIEIEPDWAKAHTFTFCDDARRIDEMFRVSRFDAIVTSPCYGNRLADNYNASDPHARRSYRIDLGHELAEGNAGGMHFARDGRYELLHDDVWRACERVLAPGGVFILSIKDFVRDGHVMALTGWHVGVLASLGLVAIDLRTVPTKGLPMTTAPDLPEYVIAFRKPS